MLVLEQESPEQTGQVNHPGHHPHTHASHPSGEPLSGAGSSQAGLQSAGVRDSLLGSEAQEEQVALSLRKH